MNSYYTVAILMAAGIALVVQNLLMVRITENASTVLIALVINSAIGLILLTSALLVRTGTPGVAEAFGAFRPWAILPGILGSFFVFAGIIGYQKVGAATTVTVLVSSQLIAGQLADAFKRDTPVTWPSMPSVLGTALLILGAYLIARERL